MKLPNKRHGKINAFYYKSPTVFHTYTLNGRTIAKKLNWMFNHITDRRPDLNKSDLRLVADQDGIRMINRTSGDRMYTEKTNGVYLWYEEKPIDISTMHENYGYNE